MDKLPIAPSQFTALVGYDETSKGWYPLAVNPATGAISQQQASSEVNELRHGQVTVTSAGALIVADRPGRDSVLIKNHGGGDLYIGNQNVETGNGLKLAAGEGVTIPGSAAIYGKSLVNVTVTAGYLEVY